jgi:hypothetical protein
MVQASQMRLQLRLGTGLLLATVTALFVQYQLAIVSYEGTLMNINESGARRLYAISAMALLRKMHIAAKLHQSSDDEVVRATAKKQFAQNAQDVERTMNAFWHVHNNLVYIYRTSFGEQERFNSRADASFVLLYPNPDLKRSFRRLSVSAADAGWRLCLEARHAASQSIEQFAAFDKRYPESFVSLAFVLQNSMMVARGMDHATSLYMYEASYVAFNLEVIFVVLAVVTATVEFVLVVLIFRKAVDGQFEKLRASVSGTLENGQSTVNAAAAAKLAALGEAGMRKEDNGRKEDAAAKAVGWQIKQLMRGLSSGQAKQEGKKKNFDESSDDDESNEGSDAEQEIDKKMEAVANLELQAAKNALAMGEDQRGILSEAAQRLRLSLFYYSCLSVLFIALTVLCFLCIKVVQTAEYAAGDINGAGRRRYIAERLVYLAYELVHAGPSSVEHGEDLLDGSITWLASIPILKCQLERSVQAMLAVHYAVLYGPAAGWTGGIATGWSRGLVREWGVDGATDLCSPFTWDKEKFDKATGTQGSVGRNALQDKLYFEGSCLTDLPATDVPRSSFTFVSERAPMPSHANQWAATLRTCTHARTQLPWRMCDCCQRRPVAARGQSAVALNSTNGNATAACGMGSVCYSPSGLGRTLLRCVQSLRSRCTRMCLRLKALDSSRTRPRPMVETTLPTARAAARSSCSAAGCCRKNRCGSARAASCLVLRAVYT